MHALITLLEGVARNVTRVVALLRALDLRKEGDASEEDIERAERATATLATASDELLEVVRSWVGDSHLTSVPPTSGEER